MDNWDHDDLLEAAARALAGHGIEATVLPPERAVADANPLNARLRLAYGAHVAMRFACVKKMVTPATLGAVQAELTRRARDFGEAPVLVTDYVTPPLAERLQALAIEFVDAAGNASLATRDLLIRVCGRRRNRPLPGAKAPGRAFGPSGLRVLFALLCKPERVAQNYRTLAREADVAHGTVGWVLADLRDQGFVIDAGQGSRRRRLTQISRLTDLWVEVYARVLRPRQILARFTTDDFEALISKPRQPPGTLVGGEIAAARITGYLKPGTATFWADSIDPRFVIENRLVLDAAGPIEILRRFWTFPTTQPDVVPDLLTYADLLAIGDARTLEAAQMMQDRVLDRSDARR